MPVFSEILSFLITVALGIPVISEIVRNNSNAKIIKNSEHNISVEASSDGLTFIKKHLYT